MARYILVAGDTNSIMQEWFKPFPDIDITNTFYSVDSLTKDVMVNGVSFLQLVKSVVILDYGFTSDKTEGRVDEFIHLQDVLKSNSLKGTKLYLITKDTDLYAKLRDDVDGVPGVHYVNTEVLLLEGEYKQKILGDIFKGRRDRTGLYHPDVDKENLSVRMLDDRDEFIRDSQSVSQDILRYGKDLPVSELSKTDFTDTPVVEEGIVKREREDNKRRREEERRRNREKDRNKRERPVTKRGSEGVKINRVKESIKVRPAKEVIREEDVLGEENRLKSLPNIRRLKKGFSRLQSVDGLVDKKVSTDKGVISFVGDRKSGTSGLVANVADTYATLGKKVLVIDLDIHQRSQTLYFGGYDRAVEEHLGLGNGLIKVAQGGTIQRTAVQITSRVSVLGISRKERIDDKWVGELAEELPTILEDARSHFDIVLVDIPYDNLEDYLEGIVRTVDKNLFIVENKWYTVDNFIYLGIGNLLNKKGEIVEELFNKSSIVLNKFQRGRVNLKGEEVTRQTVTKGLLQYGFPYDLMSVIGEIPFYDNWEIQYVTNTRYIWEDKLSLGVYKYLVNRVVW